MDNDKFISYDRFLEKLKIEIGDFLRCAERGKVVRYHSLKSRKKSIKLREILKEFRQLSLKHEKQINNIYKQTKDKISKLK